MARSVFFLALLSSLGIALPVSAQSREYLLKAGYIEKFTHFVEWPVSHNLPEDEFVILVIGNSRYGSALDDIFGKVRVLGKPVRITPIVDVSEIRDCHILIVAQLTGTLAEQVFRQTRDKPILTISDTNGYGGKGSILNLVVMDDYVRFEVNQGALQASGLKISSLVLSSAVVVHDD